MTTDQSPTDSRHEDGELEKLIADLRSPSGIGEPRDHALMLEAAEILAVTDYRYRAICKKNDELQAVIAALTAQPARTDEELAAYHFLKVRAKHDPGCKVESVDGCECGLFQALNLVDAFFTHRVAAPRQEWRTMDSAPKDGGHYDGSKYISPDRILLRFGEEAVSVAYYDPYYDVGVGGVCDPIFPWIEPCSGEPLNLHFTTPPSAWMPLPAAPAPLAGKE